MELDILMVETSLNDAQPILCRVFKFKMGIISDSV